MSLLKQHSDNRSAVRRQNSAGVYVKVLRGKHTGRTEGAHGHLSKFAKARAKARVLTDL